MIILSHRGLWRTPAEKNSATAFERSFELGFGTETDLRDMAGKIVISHDMPTGSEMTFAELLQILNGRNLPLALNIKADGLTKKILETLREYHHTNYFTFDMSIPDMIFQVKKGLKVFSGLSDINPSAPLVDQTSGVWLDAFNSVWYTPATIIDLLNQGKQVCVVSEDLHQRDNTAQWAMLKKNKLQQNEKILLCTDFPEAAREYFQHSN